MRKRVEGGIYSDYIGVIWDKKSKKWKAYICVNKHKGVHLGLFVNELDAAMAYDNYIIENNIDRRLNFSPPEPEIIIPNTRWIILTHGLWTLVDAKNYDWLNSYKCYADNHSGQWYAYINIKVGNKFKKIPLHRYILGVTDPKLFVDHKDHLTLKNIEDNIRICTSQQNQWNKKASKNSSSKHKCVSFKYRPNNKGQWEGCITLDGKSVYLGRSKSEELLARRYNMVAQWYFEDWAWLNKFD